MSEDEPITDLDLMAYADGLFVADCTRRRCLERHLAECPEDAERVAHYRAQNAAIRAAYEDLLTEKVPDEIEHIFAQPDKPARSMLRRVAAASLIAAVAATAGWYASDALEGGVSSSSDRLVKLAARHASNASLAVASASEKIVQPHRAGNTRMMMELTPPDLSAQRLRLARFDRVSDADGAAMRLSYIDEQGKAVSLFLRPSRPMRPPEIRVQVESGVAVASWQTGPFTVALTAETNETVLARLATAVQAAIGESMLPASVAPRVAGNPLPAPQSGRSGKSIESTLPDSVQVPKVN